MHLIFYLLLPPSDLSSMDFLLFAISFRKNSGTGAPMAAAFSTMLPSSVKIYQAVTSGVMMQC